jgi:hypothetical protein
MRKKSVFNSILAVVALMSGSAFADGATIHTVALGASPAEAFANCESARPELNLQAGAAVGQPQRESIWISPAMYALTVCKNVGTDGTATYSIESAAMASGDSASLQARGQCQQHAGKPVGLPTIQRLESGISDLDNVFYALVCERPSVE